jgi:hypothetical protein
MAHGITLKMRKIRRPAPDYVVRHEAAQVKQNGRLTFRRVGKWEARVNEEKDRSLPGKARRRARRAARAAS